MATLIMGDHSNSLFMHIKLPREPIDRQTFSKSDGKCLWQDGSLLPLSAALVGDYGDLMPEKERVHLGKQPMLKVEWPGYPSRFFKLGMRSGGDLPETVRLVRLTKVVAKVTKKFIELAQERHIVPWPKEWKAGPNGIRFEDLRLVFIREKVSRKGLNWEARLTYKPIPST